MYYSLWRRLLKVFWWLVVAYTMLVLITIYTFQFEDFPAYWKNFTGFTEEQYVPPHLTLWSRLIHTFLLDLSLCLMLKWALLTRDRPTMIFQRRYRLLEDQKKADTD